MLRFQLLEYLKFTEYFIVVQYSHRYCRNRLVFPNCLGYFQSFLKKRNIFRLFLHFQGSNQLFSRATIGYQCDYYSRNCRNYSEFLPAKRIFKTDVFVDKIYNSFHSITFLSINRIQAVRLKKE